MTPFVFRCSECGKEYQRDEVTYLCPDCSVSYTPGNPLRGVLEVVYDLDVFKKNFSKLKDNWEWLMPVEKEYFPKIKVGDTPFIQSERLGDHFGFKRLWIKNDTMNPSGSFKDRASYLVVAEANRLGETEIVAASTGNAASSLSTICAAEGKRAVIFVPETAPKAKMVQNILCGAKVIPVKGTYDDAFKLSMEYTKKHGGLNRNTAYHPFTIEGKKSAGLEIFAQNNYKTPDAILIPVGDGVIISGVYKAFKDLNSAGMLDKMPRMICVQAESSNAIHKYISTGEYSNAKHPDTIADSISVIAPSNAELARRAVIESNGFSLTVTDDEIIEGQKILAEKTGVFAEPSASIVVAAMKQIAEKKLLGENDQIVLLVTGHGLKDIDTPLKYINMPDSVEVE